MKNQVRRFSQTEYETLMASLRLHGEHMKMMAKELPKEIFERGLPGFKEAIKKTLETELSRSQNLLQRISNLYHHDCDWIGDGSAKWCLACNHRHEPHCPNCAGCLPEELPE